MSLVIKVSTIFLSSILIGFAFNQFLIPHHILSGGVTGLSLILNHFFSVNSGLFNFLLNIPILVLGSLKLGKKFMVLSILSVVFVSTAMYIIPVSALASDPIMSSVFGGVLIGIGVGLIFRSGASSGGFDVIGLIVTQKRDLPVGSFIFTLNAAVVFVAGFLFNWDLALYTLVSMYVIGRVIDFIHTSQVKVTLTIITNKGNEIKEALLSQMLRGITVMEGEGAYTKEKRTILMMVITRYELPDVKKLVHEIDPEVFVNITGTIEVFGNFRRETA